MRLHQLKTTHSRPKSRRVGRGNASGSGTTAGRGTKGQKARTGFNLPRTFTGGGTPDVQRLPKLKGFKSRQIKPVTVSLRRVAAVFAENEEVTLLALLEKGLVSTSEALRGVKIVGAEGIKASAFKFEQDNPKLTFTKKLLA